MIQTNNLCMQFGKRVLFLQIIVYVLKEQSRISERFGIRTVRGFYREYVFIAQCKFRNLTARYFFEHFTVCQFVSLIAAGHPHHGKYDSEYQNRIEDNSLDIYFHLLPPQSSYLY